MRISLIVLTLALVACGAESEPSPEVVLPEEKASQHEPDHAPEVFELPPIPKDSPIQRKDFETLGFPKTANVQQMGDPDGSRQEYSLSAPRHAVFVSVKIETFEDEKTALTKIQERRKEDLEDLTPIQGTIEDRSPGHYVVRTSQPSPEEGVTIRNVRIIKLMGTKILSVGAGNSYDQNMPEDELGLIAKKTFELVTQGM